MAERNSKRHYRSTESKYKGGAHEMYVTYDLEQKTRGGDTATFPKVKRTYIAGDVKDWETGVHKKRSGREAYGVMIEYEQNRGRHQRKEYTAKRGDTAYKVSPASVEGSSQMFKQVVEIPEKAKNIHFYSDASQLPAKYRDALQEVR